MTTDIGRHDAGTYAKVIAGNQGAQYRPSDIPISSGSRADVLGLNRTKYFRRPIVPNIDLVPAVLVLAPEVEQDDNILVHTERMEEMEGPKEDGPTRTIGIQTDYREAEVQTDPWSADVITTKGEEPEVLRLRNLTYSEGTLPADIRTIELIEKMRARRQFEAQLPSGVDSEHDFQRRVELLAEQDLRDWADREEEIRQAHEARLMQLASWLERREKEAYVKRGERLDEIRIQRMEERQRSMVGIQKQRVRALRKLARQRKLYESKSLLPISSGKSMKQDVIAAHCNWASSVYVPLLREGIYGAQFDDIVEIDSVSYHHRTLEGLAQTENALPGSLRIPTGERSAYATKKFLKSRDLLSRRSKRLRDTIYADLDTISTTMKVELEATQTPAITGEKEAPRELKGAVQIKREIGRRPPTPSVNQEGTSFEVHDAAVFLQKLVRGRATQNQMFIGKERRIDLIHELRLAEELDTIRRRAALPDEDKSMEERREAMDHQLEDVKHKLLSASIGHVQGRVIAHTLDFLAKERIRRQQEARVLAFTSLAESIRRNKEHQEKNRRVRETTVRDKEDDRYQRIEGIHQRTAESYLAELVRNTTSRIAKRQAIEESKAKSEALNRVLDESDRRYKNPRQIVSTLVSSFVIPEVERQYVKRRVQVEQKKYLYAARAALEKSMGDLEEDME